MLLYIATRVLFIILCLVLVVILMLLSMLWLPVQHHNDMTMTVTWMFTVTNDIIHIELHICFETFVL